MSTRIIHRPARTTPGAPPVERREIERPPEMPEDAGGMNFLMLVPMLGAGVSMTVMMLFRGSGLAAIGAMVMVVTVLAFVVMMFSQRGKAAQRRRTLCDRYLTYLDRLSAELSAQEEEWLLARRAADPHPRAMASLTRAGERLWERRRDDEDFLRLRIGTGDVPARDFVRVGDDNPLRITDELMAAELERVERRYATGADAPVVVDLDGVGNVSVVGDPRFTHRVARTLTCQAAALSSPEDVLMALAAPPGRRVAWDWMAWLPHVADQDRPTALGPARRLARDGDHLGALLRPELHRRLSVAAETRRNLRGTQIGRSLARVWAVIDGHGAPAAELPVGDREVTPGDLGVTVLHLLDSREDEPDDIALRISADPDVPDGVLLERYARRDRTPVVHRAVLDDFSAAVADALARHLAGLRLSPDSLEHSASQEAMRAADLLGIDDVTDIDVDAAWEPRPRSSFLRVQIGEDDHGDPVMLDLKESAQYGMGPHGLAIGATGSGKSELLRTIVLGLVVAHGPADVNLVLVDYKGGAAFAPFADLPQVAGVITNLGDDANLVERVYASLAGEIQRRQELLKAAGNLSDITSYRKRRAERAGTDGELEPLPHLVVIIDEFGELLTAQPDFIDLFLSIGRIGRSIGVHLLLSSQRIEGGKLRGLDTYLSYRIGLRTLSEAESRTVLDTPDAFSLPPLPGYGYLKVDTTTYTRFRAGYVSGPLPVEDDEVESEDVPGIVPLARYTVLAADAEGMPAAGRRDEAHTGGGAPDGGGEEDEDDENRDTVLATVLAQLAARPRETAPIWLEPLPPVLTLDQVAGTPMPSARGYAVPQRRAGSVPVGMLDDPARQWQDVFHLGLAPAGGHTLVVGAPRTGKTTFLQTVAAAAALTHTPEECVIYGLDLLGAGLAALQGLPNVAGVATRMERDVVRRTVEEVHTAMTDREDLLQRHHLPDLVAARDRRDAGDADLADAQLADVLVLVDGMGQVGEEFAEIEDDVRDLIRRGAGLGVHVVATATRANEVRLNLQTYFGSRVELRLNDPGESAVGRKLAEALRADRPGQFLHADGLFGQIALPRVDGVARPETAAVGLADLVARSAESARSEAPPVRLLPAVVGAADLEAPPSGQEHLVPLGLRESDLGTLWLDPEGGDRNLVLLGDGETGRTSALRLLARRLMERYTPEELVFAVVDPRRTLAGAIPEEYVGAYAASAGLAERLVAAMLPELRERTPHTVDGSPDVAAPLPRIVLLVDDYDVLTAGGTSPLAELRPFLAMSHELNFSAVIARRTAGASRGLFDPVLTTVRESGATGLMFSGDRAEGPLLGGVRPQRLPVGRAVLIRAGQRPVTVQVASENEDGDDELHGVGFARR